MAFDPVTAGIGLATTIGGGIFGAMGQAEENRKNRKAAKKQNKYNKKVWRFNNSEQDRIYDFKVEEQKIAKRNYEADIQFQEDSRQQQWDYQMGIRDYQFSQEMRAYDESVARATRQKSFNQMAEEQSLLDQQRYLQETLQGIGFTETQTMLDFASASAGLEVKRGQAQAQSQLSLGQAQAKSQLAISQIEGSAQRQMSQAARKSEQEISQAERVAQLEVGQAKGAAKLSRQRIEEETALGIKQARSQTQLARQQSSIEALKARGTALAAGQAGRSARKVAQGITAEAGAQQAGLVEQFKLSEESALQKQFFDVMSIDQQLMFTEQNVAQSLMNLRQNSLQQLLNTQQTLGQESMFAQQNSLLQLTTTQQNVVQQLMFTEQGIDLDLTSLNSQLELDRQMISASRENLSAADASARRRINLARQQADLEAEANIRLKPEIAPPLPEPMTLPRKEWAKIFRPGEAPEPNKVQAQVTNPYLTLGQSVLGGIGGLASAGAFDNMFTPQSSGFDMGNLSNIFSLDNQNPLTTLSGFPTSSISSGLT